MTPLDRLAADLARVAACRWIADGMRSAFVYGLRDHGGFNPLEWLGKKPEPPRGLVFHDHEGGVTFWTGIDEPLPPKRA